MKHIILAAFGALGLLLSDEAPSPALSVDVQSMDEQNAARAAMKAGEIMPYNKLKKLVEKKAGGSIVGQRLRRTGRGWMYEFRIRAKKGHVHYVMVNAKTGQIIRQNR